MISIMADQLGRHQVRIIYEFHIPHDASKINLLKVRTYSLNFVQVCRIYNRLYCTDAVLHVGKQRNFSG